MSNLYALSSLNVVIQFYISIVALIAANLCSAEPASSSPLLSQIHTIDSGCLTPRYDDHCERWVSVYDHPGSHGTIFNDPVTGVEFPAAQAISPGSDRVYVTGFSWDNSLKSSQWATVAFDTITGKQLWVSRHGAPGLFAFPSDVAVSPDGSRIYVTGQQNRLQQQSSYFLDATTIAYDAATGHQLWLATYRVPFADAFLNNIAVSPDGSRVYVSGGDTAGGDFGRNDTRYVTLAYSASTGFQEWVAFRDNAGVDDDEVTMALDRSGKRLYIGGTAGIVVYDTAHGAELWSTTQPAYSLIVASDGSQLFAAETGFGPFGNDFHLAAYAAATGKQSWSVPLPPIFDFTPFLVADPSGVRLYAVTTQDASGGTYLFQNLNPVTIALEAKSGRLIWSTKYDDTRFSKGVGVANILDEQFASGLTVSPDGKRLYLAASAIRLGPTEFLASDVSTVAYDAATGSQKWVGRYSVSPLDFDIPADPFPAQHSIGVTPDGSKVVLAADFNHHPFGAPNDLFARNRTDYGLLAYDTDVVPAVRARKAVSRKVQGAAGTFDIAGIECRSGGPNNDYQMVITFPGPVTFGRAAVTSGTGRVASTSSNGAEVTVNLTGVANAQTITLTLVGVSDGVNTNDVSVPLSVLVGDVSASGSVTTILDLDLVQGELGHAASAHFFRFDVTADGVINKADLSLVKSNVGTVLP